MLAAMADTRAQPTLRERLLVRPGRKVDLAACDPDETFGHQKAGALEELTRGVDRLTDLQERLWANGKQAVLVILQGIDTAGKDGTIRHVMGAFNPQGCDVVGFKVPTPEELAHDFLWRAHKAVPPKGSVAIFNRSHYEDVLVVRVHELVPASVWRQRYGQINEFEQLLSETGTTILKFFLLIDQDEQKERLQARLDDPTKRWKFSSADLEERKRWDDVHGGLRGDARALLAEERALVRHPVEPQVVPEPGRGGHPGRHARRPAPAIPGG